MDTLLLILGAIGLVAIVISAYVFTVAARNYVSEDESDGGAGEMQERRREERRSGVQVTFPLSINGMELTRDRRRNAERRNGYS